MYKSLFTGTRDTASLSTYKAIGLFSFGLISFLWISCKTVVLLISEEERFILQPLKTHTLYPSIEMEQNIAQLYSHTASQTAQDSKTRFRIQGVEHDDNLLLAAPRARIDQRLVGILASSNPAKSMVILDGSRQQTSYGLGDKIAGKFTILRIFDDRVVINENGYYAALFLAK